MKISRGSSTFSIKIHRSQHVTKQLRSYCAKGGGAAASKTLVGAETNGRMQGNLRDLAFGSQPRKLDGLHENDRRYVYHRIIIVYLYTMSQIVAMTIDDVRSDFVWFGLFTLTMILCPQICVNWLCLTIYAYMQWLFAYFASLLNVSQFGHLSKILSEYQGRNLTNTYKVVGDLGPFQRVHSQHVQTSGGPLINGTKLIYT